MQLKLFRIVVISVALFAAASVLAHDAASSPVVANADLQWKDMGNGINAAPVSGDMGKGPSRFFLKYPVGLVTPKHHHTTDHYVVLVSGAVTLTVEGHDHKLGPGSYFALTDKASHIAKVEGNEPAVFFIQAEGPWDLVLEQ